MDLMAEESTYKSAKKVDVEYMESDEDDIEEMVSGMLSSLDISMFQENPSQDVDIEAISLMGIGNPDV